MSIEEECSDVSAMAKRICGDGHRLLACVALLQRYLVWLRLAAHAPQICADREGARTLHILRLVEDQGSVKR